MGSRPPFSTARVVTCKSTNCIYAQEFHETSIQFSGNLLHVRLHLGATRDVRKVMSPVPDSLLRCTAVSRHLGATKCLTSPLRVSAPPFFGPKIDREPVCTTQLEQSSGCANPPYHGVKDSIETSAQQCRKLLSIIAVTQTNSIHKQHSKWWQEPSSNHVFNNRSRIVSASSQFN